MSDFEEELKVGFLEEAETLLGDAEQCFLSLEKNPNDLPTLEQIFRIAHNIKGSSKAVGFDALGAFTHEFESFLLKCKNGQIAITPKTISLLLRCNDHVRLFIDNLKSSPRLDTNSEELVNEIKNFTPDIAEALASITSAELPVMNEVEEPAAEPVAEETESFGIEDVQALQKAMESPQDLVSLEAQPEAIAAAPQVIAPEPPAIQPAAVVTPVPPSNPSQSAPVKQTAPTPTSGDESIRVSLSRLERLLNFVGEMVILQTVLREQSYNASPQLLRRTIHQMGKVTKEIQDLSMSLRMVPLKQTFQKMQRIVRDTSAVLGKKVQLNLEGEDTELDKTVLEALGDPLVHLVRNAVDHGIESPEARVAAGKSEAGQVNLRAYHQAGKLVIEVRDDGGGIPAARLKQKAVEKGILRADQNISDEEAVQLIFHPGFSTKAQVTEVSGRGVGMDVVKTNIEKLQGEVLVTTELGKGSVFKVILPLTLAIIDGMVVRCGDERFVLPLSHVHESMKPGANDLKFATGIGEVLMLRGENLPVLRLADALGRKRKHADGNDQIAVIVRSQGSPFAALVDDIIGQHQVVIKKLGAEVESVRGYSGTAILGDGRPALILELGELAAQASSIPKTRRIAS